MTPSASLDTLQSLPLGAVTLRAFNSRSRRQREAVNSQIIPSPGTLSAWRPNCLLLSTHLSLGSGDRSKAGSKGMERASHQRSHHRALVSHVRIRSKRGNLRACQNRKVSHTRSVSVAVTRQIPNPEATKSQAQNNL